MPSDRFVDISETPAVLAAQRAHRRLARRHGTAAAYDGLVLAGNFLRQVDVPRPAPQTLEILEVLCRHGPLLFLDPAYSAARYPRLIHLAALFITPHWRALAARYDTWPRFFAELSTRCFGHPGYVPHGNNAVSKWLSRQALRRLR